MKDPPVFVLNRSLIVIATLLYHSNLLQYTGISSKLSYAITFFAWVIAILLTRARVFFDKWILLSVASLLPSILVGLGNGWESVDILADIARYIAPFLGFMMGVAMLKKMHYHEVVQLLFSLFTIALIIFWTSLIQYVIKIFDTGVLVDYAQDALQTSTIYALIAFFLLVSKRVLGLPRILILGYLIGHVINPILVMSKARLTIVVFGALLILISHTSLRGRIKFSAVLFLIPFVLVMGANENVDYIFSRFGNTMQYLTTGSYHADASTAYRVAEIINLSMALFDGLPYTLLSGFGSGALFYDHYDLIFGGISLENYRADGGIHDIFFLPLAYLYRYGLLGSIFVALFVITNYRRIKDTRSLDDQGVLAKSLKITIILLVTSDLFVPVHFYGNFQFGFWLAAGVMLSKKFLHYSGNFRQAS